MRGHVFLTSSSEDEAAQESDLLGASFFTHYLVSGLRGAADVSGDGAVTLNEAYRFAFDETLGRTASTRGGAQHPAYDISMSGTGDVVMTDLRQTSVSLILGEALRGRCFVRNGRGQLVVELGKLPGRRVTLGLEPDDYSVRCQEGGSALLAERRLADGEEVLLEPGDFEGSEPEATWSRGGDASLGWLAGRNELALGFGFTGSSEPEAIRVADLSLRVYNTQGKNRRVERIKLGE
jgi:hypothetical protein